MVNAVKNESNDERYFTITPRLVWALSRTPYDYVLWCVVKDIAGKTGECFLSTPDLASLAMMSDGQVSISRQHWLDLGMFKGELKRDPGYPQPVYHLTIPDVWKQNIEWSEKYVRLDARIAFKQAQKKSLHQVKPSPGEEGVLPGERGVSPGEEGVLPGETKKNHKKNHKEKPKEDQVAPATNAGNRAEFEALADICKLTPPDRDWSKLPEKVRGMLNRCASQLLKAGATVELLRRFPVYWYAHDWRGQKHQHPKPEYVVSEWPTFLRDISGADWNEEADQFPGVPISHANGNGAMKPDATVTTEIILAWTAVLGELSTQLSKTTFAQMLKPTRVTHFQDDQFSVAAPSSSARDWLESRIQPSVVRALTGILNRPATVRFIAGE